MLLLDLDASARAHLRRALAEHRRWCRQNGVEFPAVLDALAVRSGQDGTRNDEDEEIFDTGSVPLAYNYRDAGELLDVGEKTVRRLVEAGELRAVTIGANNRRIPRDELLEYVERLRAGGEQGRDHSGVAPSTSPSSGIEGGRRSPSSRLRFHPGGSALDSPEGR